MARIAKKSQRSNQSSQTPTRVTPAQKREQSLAFQKIFAALNPAQKEAVEATEGPVMVIAGPGTGKTQILAARIANILQTTDVGAHNILALTFTETGAKAMRERLLTMIGELAYYVNISTFHAFCSEVIQANPEFFPFSRDAQPLSDFERYSLIETLLVSEPFEAIKPINSPNFYVYDIIKSIQNLKREGVSPEMFRKMLDAEDAELAGEEKISATARAARTRSLAKNRELLQVYILYQAQLKKLSRYDYEDMINFTVETFEKDADLLRTYQERMQYVLVDEFQDTNNGQNRVLELLAEFWGQDANIFVVGDISQSLYRFQGASIENSLSFVKQYPAAKIITLTYNYRSSQLILDAAANMIAHNAFTHTDVLKAVGKESEKTVLKAQMDLPSEPIEVAALSSSPLEAAYVAERVSALITEGVAPSQIAVLYRNNADSALFADALAKWGVKYDIDGGSNVLDDPTLAQLFTLFTVLATVRESAEDIDLFNLLNYEWVGLDALDILKVTRAAGLKHKTIYDILLDDAEVKKLKLHDVKKLAEFVNNLHKWLALDAQTSFPEWFEKVIYESGFLYWVLKKPNSVDILNKLQSLFGEVKRMATANPNLRLKSFMDTLAVMREYHIGINEEDLNVATDAVHLSTAHRAKGLEWEHVFIVNALNGKWGNTRSHDLFTLPEGILKNTDLEQKEKNEDERRLFYVALTRAKKRVTVTYSKTTISGNRTRENFPTMFLEEIPAEDRVDVDVSKFEATANVILAKLLQPAPEQRPTIEEKEWLTSILDDFVLSPTALNTYLECPYKFKLNTLMKVPRAKQDYLAFGTAVHKALEMFYRSLIEHDGLEPGLEYLLQQFEKALKKEILTEENFNQRLLQGQKMLAAYYNEYRDQFGTPLFLEKFFGYGGVRLYVDDIRIGGRIDRIDWDNPAQKTVRVIDYKTGKPRTRGEIEGTTQNSTGGYKRQLLFYKLLADLDRTFTAKVVSGTFDFIEPDKRTGKFRREEFLLGKEEVAELVELIRATMKEIRALHFPRTTKFSICKNCEFAQHCWPDGIPEETAQQLGLL